MAFAATLPATLRSALAVAALALPACAPARSAAPPASPGSARGALPVELVTSPVTGTRQWRWNSTEGIEIDTRHWVIRSSLRNSALSGALPAFY
ncbi:MAG: hypothetical protein ACKPBA_09845 [Planctomycetota bacterium]